MTSRPFDPAAIVFDLDGTLVDSRGDIVRACNAMLAALGSAPLPDDTIAGFVGDGASKLVTRALATASLPADPPAVERALELFLDAYAAHPVGHTTLMPGAREALTALAGYPLAVCTNKSRRTALLVLDGLDLTRHFAEILCGDDVARPKPDPEPLREIARRLHTEPERLIMVGDGPQDIECARAAGALGIGVRGGVLPIERLLAARPEILLETLHELPGCVAGLTR